MYITKKAAREMVNANLSKTGYVPENFGMLGAIKCDDMREMFRRCGFGSAETETIIGALVLAGAKFEK